MDAVFQSVFSTVDAFVYRCRNDKDYTMLEMQGRVTALLGYPKTDIVNNNVVSFVGLIAREDVDMVFEGVDAAIAKGEAWDIAYRLTHQDGSMVWVRERGNAIFERGELTYLQGLVVRADAEVALRTELEATLHETHMTNQGIMHLTQNITKSVRELKMLSVNARIEAARSGDAGRGFAVVADEIKILADRNAGWAQQISEKVDQIQT